MVQIVSRASDVRVTEINLSSVITSTSVTIGAQPVVSKQGVIVPKLFTNGPSWIDEYGNPDPSISMTIQAGLNYFTEGNQLWGLRVCGTGYMYAGVLLKNNTSDVSVLIGQALSDPVNTDLTNFESPGETAIAYFYPSRGPGSYGDNISIEIKTATVNSPGNFTGTGTNSGGSLTGGTYKYQISALSQLGESLVSNQITVILSGLSLPAGSVTLDWDPVPGAIGYRIYGRATGGSYGLITTVGAAVTEFLDTGDVVPDNTKLPITNPANVVGTNEFIVNVYDNTKPLQNALESFTVTLFNNVDASGTQTEIENRINPFSNYIQVVANPAVINNSPYPTVTAVAKTAMTGGDSGAAPTSSQIALAMQVFGNKSLYNPNTFIGAGLADPTYQLSLDTLVQGRGDAVSLIDVPAISQKFQDSIDYRNLSLNLNSTYSALFGPDVLQADLINGMQVYNPPSGWAGALCARTDRVANPAYSIAGLNRGLLNVLKQRYAYDDGQATALFNAQVNYTRTFVGQGIALWEQQTLAGQYSALSWLSVRRITNVIKVSLYKFLLYSLQEMDTDAIRRQIINSCSAYLQAVKDASGLYDFTVECDNGNNNATTANAGILVVTVVLVPNIPIHEIQLQVVISKQGVTFQETLNQVNGNTQ